MCGVFADAGNHGPLKCSLIRMCIQDKNVLYIYIRDLIKIVTVAALCGLNGGFAEFSSKNIYGVL